MYETFYHFLSMKESIVQNSYRTGVNELHHRKTKILMCLGHNERQGHRVYLNQ